MQLVDANVVLRYLLGDHEVLSAKARQLIESQVVEVPMEVLCEVVYVLSGTYAIQPEEVATTLQGFFESTPCTLSNRQVALKALALFAQTHLDFVDCLLAAYNSVLGATVHTFDKKLQKWLST